MLPFRRRSLGRRLVFNHGLYKRYEVIDSLKPGTKIIFSQNLSDELNGMQKFMKALRGKVPDLRSMDKKEATFLESVGYLMGKPIIRIIDEDGQEKIVRAIGYKTKNSGSIVSWNICSQNQKNETTKGIRNDLALLA